MICTSWYIFLFSVLINFHKNIYPKSLFGYPSSVNYIHNYNYFHLIRNKLRNLSATNDRISTKNSFYSYSAAVAVGAP